MALTAQVRFRRRLQELLRPRGAKAALASYCHHSPAWVSTLLAPRSKQPQVTLDDLDNIAAFFRISLGELLGAPKLGELSGDEQRMLYAFRALPPITKDHFLALLEAASLGASLIRRERKQHEMSHKESVELGYNSSIHAPLEEVLATGTDQSAILRRLLTEIAVMAGAGASGAIAPTAPPGPSGRKADSSDMAARLHRSLSRPAPPPVEES